MSNQSLYAMYVIGKVESNNNWSSVNFHDPITIGMMQWYGTRAYGLLNRGRSADPTGWSNFKKFCKQSRKPSGIELSELESAIPDAIRGERLDRMVKKS